MCGCTQTKNQVSSDNNVLVRSAPINTNIVHIIITEPVNTMFMFPELHTAYSLVPNLPNAVYVDDLCVLTQKYGFNKYIFVRAADEVTFNVECKRIAA